MQEGFWFPPFRSKRNSEIGIMSTIPVSNQVLAAFTSSKVCTFILWIFQAGHHSGKGEQINETPDLDWVGGSRDTRDGGYAEIAVLDFDGLT